MKETICKIAPRDCDAARRAVEHLESLAMPRWALGRLMDLAVDLAGITGLDKPSFKRRVVAIAAGDHGVVAEGVTNYPQSITGAMMSEFVSGGAGINALAGVARTDIVLADFGVKSVPPDVAAWDRFVGCAVGRGTRDFAEGPAMSREEAEASIENGIALANRLADAGYEAIGLGEVGIGNTTPSAAIIACITGEDPKTVTGPGTGLSDAQLAHKAEVVARGLALNRPDPSDGLDVLAKVGGFEIGGMAGICLGAAARRIPVVVDGLITAAGALVAATICPLAREYMVASHLSAEPGHRHALARLGLKPYLDLRLRLGEGTGAALMMNLLDSAAAILSDVDSFDDLACAAGTENGAPPNADAQGTAK